MRTKAMLIGTIFLFSSSHLAAVVKKQRKDIELLQVFAGKREIINPTLSPSGNYLAYTETNFKGITVYDFTTKKKISVTKSSGAGYKFTWAPGSFRLVYRTITYSRKPISDSTNATPYNTVKQKKYSIEIFDLANNFRKSIYVSYSPIGNPVWSTNGRRIFFPVKVDGVRKFKSYAFVYHRNAKKIEQKGSDLFYYPTKKGLLVGRNGGQKLDLVSPDEGDLFDAIVSPNQQFIIFETKSHKLLLTDIKGKNAKFISKGTGAKWANDSQRIAYSNTTDPKNTSRSDIYIYHLSNARSEKITHTTQALEVSPIWTQSGKSILYTMRHDNGLYLKKLH